MVDVDIGRGEMSVEQGALQRQHAGLIRAPRAHEIVGQRESNVAAVVVSKVQVVAR